MSLTIITNIFGARFGIVEPYSSGTDFPEALAKLGWEVVHIEGDTDFIPKLQHTPTAPLFHCDYFVPYTNDLQNTLQELQKLDVAYIITGYESAVCFADKLNDFLGLPSNGISKSLARRDKYVMHQTVEQFGLRVPKQRKISCAEESLVWKQTNQIEYPIVIKPLSSAGADGFNLVHTDKELIDVVEKLIGSQNIFGELNKEVLVQEYINGDEYIVNTVSVDGQHYVTDVWVYNKGSVNDASIVDFDSKLLAYEEVNPELIKYAKGVLNALEYRVGPAHMEIKIDDKGQPTLIEVGARLAGVYGHRVIQQCAKNGKSQLEYTIDAYVNKDALEDLKDGYELKKKGFVVCLISSVEGKIDKINYLDEIKALPSFQEIKFSISEGEFLMRTVDLFTSPGFVYLAHENENQLLSDYNQFRALEQKMYSIAP